MSRDKVIRIQGDKMCEYLGLPKGTKINLDVLHIIEHAEVNKPCNVMNKDVVITMHMKATAGILIKKINGEKAWVS